LERCEMTTLLIIGALLLTHAIALAGGIYLHYAFGAKTLAAAKAVEGAFKG